MSGLERYSLEPHPLDEALADPQRSGPAASLARSYLATPRSLLWWHPSRDWRVVVVLPPMASRMALLRNPIFGSLVRQWGSHLRAFGIDQHRLVRDFGPVLPDEMLSRLMVAISRQPEVAHHEVLDVLLAALDGWERDALYRTADDPPGEHGPDPGMDDALARDATSRPTGLMVPLMRAAALEPGRRDSLFERSWRYPELLEALREALRGQRIDQGLYVRLMASIETRETLWEHRLAARLEAELDPQVRQALHRSPCGLHLGAYNWLMADPRHRAQRLNFLHRMPLLCAWVADNLLPLPPPVRNDPELRQLADTPERRHLNPMIQQAIDSGQDRLIIATLATRFAVQDNTLRRLWHLRPASLASVPAWQVSALLTRLDHQHQAHWPTSPQGWLSWVEQCIPGVVGGHQPG